MAFGKRVTLLVWLLGLAVLVGLTIWYGADLVVRAIIDSGWAVLLVIVARVVAVAGAGAGWWLLFPPDARPSAGLCVLLRFVREGANALLPMAQIGGDFIGARCLALKGVRGTVAAASVIVDVWMQAMTQVVFALVGLLLLISMGGHEVVAWPIAIEVAVAGPLLLASLVAQGAGGQRLLTRLLTLVVGHRDWQMFGTIDDLFARLRTFYDYRRGLLQSSVWHLTMWFVGALEVWIVLHFIGYPITFE